METNIKIVDAMCGAGKTSWAIQMINAAEKSLASENSQTKNTFTLHRI